MKKGKENVGRPVSGNRYEYFVSLEEWVMSDDCPEWIQQADEGEVQIEAFDLIQAGKTICEHMCPDFEEGEKIYHNMSPCAECPQKEKYGS